VTSRLEDAIAASFGSCCEALKYRTFFYIYAGNFKRVDIRTVVVLCVRNGGLENFLNDARALGWREGQNIERLINRLSAHQIRYQTAFLRRESNATQICVGFHDAPLLLGSGFFAARVTLEGPRQSELTKLVANHIF